jgi:uncharacterized small protein (DUF1192 family)
VTTEAWSRYRFGRNRGDGRQETGVAIDPFLDEKPRPKPTHEIGQDLSLLSIDEIDERIALLEGEIGRLKQVRAKKDASRLAAEKAFKS